MDGMPRDAFSSRLHEQPSDAHLTFYRRPVFESYMRYLWEPLLACNRAQAIMLAEEGLLAGAETDAILDGLDELETSVDRDGFEDVESFEGPYFFIEDALRESAGETAAGKLHTGRSRNDLYAAAVRMAVRERVLGMISALVALRSTLLDRADGMAEVVVPAFTHSQPAQPITIAHYLLAVDHAMARAVDRLRAAYGTTNRSPLGAAAIGGTGFGIDRERLAELLGFDGVVYNTYDAIATVDYLPETGAAVAGPMTTISRVSQDLLTWSMFELGFVELSESLSTVSSIMPQKKNPGVLEKTRARASDAIAAATGGTVALKAVPFGDVGETWDAARPVLDGADTSIDAVRLFEAIIGDVTFHEDRMYEDAVAGFCTMTEVADTLVREGGLSFREAHEVVGGMVHTVIEDGRTADEITIADLNEASRTAVGETGLIGDDELAAALDPRTNVRRRDVLGGTAPDRAREDLERQRSSLREQRTWLDGAVDALESASQRRRAGR